MIHVERSQEDIFTMNDNLNSNSTSYSTNETKKKPTQQLSDDFPEVESSSSVDMFIVKYVKCKLGHNSSSLTDDSEQKTKKNYFECAFKKTRRGLGQCLYVYVYVVARRPTTSLPSLLFLQKKKKHSSSKTVVSRCARVRERTLTAAKSFEGETKNRKPFVGVSSFRLRFFFFQLFRGPPSKQKLAVNL